MKTLRFILDKNTFIKRNSTDVAHVQRGIKLQRNERAYLRSNYLSSYFILHINENYAVIVPFTGVSTVRGSRKVI